MSEQSGSVDDTSWPVEGSGDTSDRPSAWGRIPNVVVDNEQLTAKALALLAYHLTKTRNFSLSEKAAQRGLPLSKGARGRKIGNHKLRQQRANLMDLGYLVRYQPKLESGRYTKSVEQVLLPEAQYYRRVEEGWQDGSLGDTEIAILIFIRASNRGRTRKQIQSRFDMSKHIAGKALRGLKEKGYICEERLKNEKGQLGEIYYHDKTTFSRNKRSTAEISTHGDSTHGQATDGVVGDLLTERTAHIGTPSYIMTVCHGMIDYSSSKSPKVDANALAILRTAALNDRRLLGWLCGYSDPEVCDILTRLDETAFDEVADCMEDEELLQRLRAVCEGRVSPHIESCAGLYALRHLAAAWIGATGGSPELGLEKILDEIQDRVGKQARQLNGLALVGKAIVGQIMTLVQRDLASTAQQIFARDYARLLTPSLRKDTKGLRRILCLAPRQIAVDAIFQALHDASTGQKGQGAIRSWDYFGHAIEIEARRVMLTNEGLRPGDLLGRHRDWIERGDHDDLEAKAEGQD